MYSLKDRFEDKIQIIRDPASSIYKKKIDSNKKN